MLSGLPARGAAAGGGAGLAATAGCQALLRRAAFMPRVDQPGGEPSLPS